MIDFIEQISPLQMIVALVIIAIIAHIALGFVLKQITKHSDSTETQIAVSYTHLTLPTKA